DVVYMRDGAAEDYATIWEEQLPPIAALKLAALFELFRLPDCAVELILAHRARIAPFIDPERLLDALTPLFEGKRLSYRQYVELFRLTPERFFPRALKSDISPSAKPGLARLFGR